MVSAAADHVTRYPMVCCRFCASRLRFRADERSALKRAESDGLVGAKPGFGPVVVRDGGAEFVSANGGWGARWGSNPRPSD